MDEQEVEAGVEQPIQTDSARVEPDAGKLYVKVFDSNGFFGNFTVGDSEVEQMIREGCCAELWKGDVRVFDDPATSIGMLYEQIEVARGE